MFQKIYVLRLLASIVICEIVEIIGSVFAASFLESWYLLLEKPVFTPRVFFPVWTSLYMLMGVSLYLVWEKGCSKEKSNQGFSFSECSSASMYSGLYCSSG
jgi:benzodiazapine receptor